MLLSRLQGAGIARLGKEHAEHALEWYPDDIDQAYDVLVLANESIEGELKDFDPDVTMVGAINRNMVTCYLDALLFAMFARLDSFEAMLYDNFDDEPRKKLAATLRLWVNLLRTGRLIKVELVSSMNIPTRLYSCPARQNICRTLSQSVDGKMLPKSVSKMPPKPLLSLPVPSNCRYSL